MQETIEQIKINVQFRRKMGIDFNLWCACIITPIRVLKHPCPAVAAAEITFVSDYEMKVHENLIT